MGYIYKITNDINGKVYIGQTSISIEERFNEHIHDSKQYDSNKEKRPLYDAINKYGIEHFYIEKVEECPIDKLPEREIYWIAYYKGYEDGYNGTKGGEGRPLYNHEEIKKRLLEYPYPVEIAEEFNCSRSLIYQIAKINNIKVQNKSNIRMKNEYSKEVQQYSKNNEYIQTFPSIADAARWCFENKKCVTLTSGVRGHISEVCNNKRKTAYGYIWHFAN